MVDANVVQIEYPGPAGSPQRYAYYIHTDALGAPRILTNQSAQVVWAAVMRPYGDLVEATAPDSLSGRTVVTNLRLPGQYDERLLNSIGLQGPYYNWNRWYLPGVGRYLELDPIALAGGINGESGVDWYNYASGNPLRYRDPRGLYGTNSCEYYQDACQKYGGKYYCEQAPYWCEWFGDHFGRPPDPDPTRDDDYEGWTRCTRQCLQDCDAGEHNNDNTCKAEADNRNGPWDLRYWKPESKSFTCHAACYSWCAAPMGLGDPNLPLRGNPFK